MKTKNFFSCVIMYFLTLVITLTSYSCSREDINNGNDSPINITDTKDSDLDDKNNNTSGDNKVECRYYNGFGNCSGSNCNNGECFYCDCTGYTYIGNHKSQYIRCEKGKYPVCNGKTNVLNAMGDVTLMNKIYLHYKFQVIKTRYSQS